MSGTVVQATSLDSVRIDVLGEGRAVTIPCSVILGIDRVMRHATHSGRPLKVHKQAWGATFMASILDGKDLVTGTGDTAWGAVVALGEGLEARR